MTHIFVQHKCEIIYETLEILMACRTVLSSRITAVSSAKFGHLHLLALPSAGAFHLDVTYTHTRTRTHATHKQTHIQMAVLSIEIAVHEALHPHMSATHADTYIRTHTSWTTRGIYRRCCGPMSAPSASSLLFVWHKQILLLNVSVLYGICGAV